MATVLKSVVTLLISRIGQSPLAWAAGLGWRGWRDLSRRRPVSLYVAVQRGKASSEGIRLKIRSAGPRTPDDAQRPGRVAGAHKLGVRYQEGREDEHLRPAVHRCVEMGVLLLDSSHEGSLRPGGRHYHQVEGAGNGKIREAISLQK